MMNMNSGIYDTNPNAKPNSLGGLNQYGTLLILNGASYPTAIYISTVGQLAVWAYNNNSWSIIKS